MAKKRQILKSASSTGLASRHAGLIALSFIALGLVMSLFGAPLEHYFGRTIEFRARTLLGRDPQLTDSLRVFAFDDEAASMRGGRELTPIEWANIISTIAARHPRTILIDRSFPHPMAPVEGRLFKDSMATGTAPLIGKALVSQQELSHLGGLPPDRFGIGFPRLVPDPTDRPRRLASWLETPHYIAYGPSEPMASAFTGLGHGELYEGGTILPFLTLAPTAVMPHWSLMANGMPRIVKGRLTVGGHVVDLDEDDGLPVNLITAAKCQERVVSLAGLLAGGESGERTLAWMRPGDTVVILTDMRQASTAQTMTALGKMPTAFTELAAISSAVSGHWLDVYPGRVLLTSLFCLLAALLATKLTRMRLLIVVLVTSAVLATAGVLTFVYLGAQIPWFAPALSFLGCGVAAAAAAFRQDHVRLALLRHDLDGRISPDKLQAMLEQDSLSRLEASEQVVTIMFIDIVGFSRSSEKQTPKEAFSSLKGLIDQMRKAVHDHGGVVDRTMGDGMLCVFGFEMGESSSGVLHAVQAMQCAAEIQRDNLRRMLRAQKSHEAVFPLRIGVNTAGVYVGNLGDSDKTDLTVIGSGVNFAQRLEAACDRHMVMLGAATRDLVHLLDGLGEGLRKRHIRVKHSQELVEAYELDPFYGEPQLLLDGDDAYRQLVGIERNDVRWPIPYPGLIQISTTYGNGEIVNFSLDGFTIKLSEYYAKDVPLSLRMDTADGELAARLERAGLESIMLEVRWARPAGQSYVHGCQMKSLSRDQRVEVIAMLRDIIQRHGLTAAARIPPAGSGSIQGAA